MSRSSVTHRTVLFNWLLTMLLILGGLVSLGAPTHASSTMPQCRFDPDGYFYIKGSSPQGFEEFDHIQLLVTDHVSALRQPPDSHLSAKNGRSYRFVKLAEFRTHSSGGGINFAFTTETIEGVSYQFAGKFDSICVLAEEEGNPKNVVALGRLLKFEKGQKKVAADVEFTYSEFPRRQASSQSHGGSEPPAGTGIEVLAIVSMMELKAYTDRLSNGSLLVSDIIRFDVVDPKERAHITVTAYYQGAPIVQGKRLQVGDLVRFERPPGPQRHGILLGDIKGLRFRE